jgi:hypothetical protein
MNIKNDINIYAQFNNNSLQYLLNEAEIEEEQGIRWKKRKFKKN